MELNRREAQRSVIVRENRSTKQQDFETWSARRLREHIKILKNAWDNYNIEHLTIVENVAVPNDLQVQDDARAAVQELYVEALEAMEERLDVLDQLLMEQMEREEQDRERERLERVEQELEQERERERELEQEREQERQRNRQPDGQQENEDGNEQHETDQREQVPLPRANEGRHRMEDYVRLGAAMSIEQLNRAVQDNGEGAAVIRRPRIERDEFLLDHFKPPKFNGSYSKWNEWRSAYESMIHHSTLTDTRKMFLLKDCLTEGAQRVLSGWQVVGENYASAYETLCSVYQNTYRISISHLNELFSVPALSVETYDGLRKLIDTTNSVLRQLRVTGSPVEHWDHIVIFWLLIRMPPRTLTLWEDSSDLKEMPTLEAVLQFLEKRARGSLNQEASGHWKRDNNRASSENVNNSAHVSLSARLAIPQQEKTEPKRGIACNNCQQPHPMFRCAKFLAMSPSERKNRVRELGICANCFSTGHKTNSLSCKAGPCKRCNKGLNHNTLICNVPAAASNALALTWQTQAEGEEPQGMATASVNAAAMYQPPGAPTQEQSGSCPGPTQAYYANANQDFQ